MRPGRNWWPEVSGHPLAVGFIVMTVATVGIWRGRDAVTRRLEVGSGCFFFKSAWNKHRSLTRLGFMNIYDFIVWTWTWVNIGYRLLRIWSMGFSFAVGNLEHGPRPKKSRGLVGALGDNSLNTGIHCRYTGMPVCLSHMTSWPFSN